MATYTDHGKTSSAGRNCGWKPKLNERDRHTLERIVSKHHRTAAAKLTAELSIRPEDHVSTKTVQRELHKSNIHSRAAVAKPLITDNKAKRWNRWCDDHKTCTSDGRKYIMWSAELSFMLFPTSGWTPKAAYNPEYLVPTVKHGGRSVMIG